MPIARDSDAARAICGKRWPNGWSHCWLRPTRRPRPRRSCAVSFRRWPPTSRHPALAALLADKDLADPALRGLTMIPGVAVDQILREALEKTSGILKIGMVNALGERGDRAAAEAIGKLLDSDDEPLACAAAGALGKIGGDDGSGGVAAGAGECARPTAGGGGRCVSGLRGSAAGERQARIGGGLVRAACPVPAKRSKSAWRRGEEPFCRSLTRRSE